MTTLYHLVSGQTLVNFVLADFIKPERNILLFSKESRGKLSNLKKLLGPNTEELEIDAWDYASIYKTINDSVTAQTGDVYLNFTAGTKIMSIASFEVFKNLEKSCFYLNSQQNEIIKYTFEGAITKRENLPLKTKISIRDYFSLYGQTVEYDSCKLNAEEEKLVDFLDQNMFVFAPFILNDYSTKLSHKRYSDLVNDYKTKNNLFTGSKAKYANCSVTFLKESMTICLGIGNDTPKKFTFTENLQSVHEMLCGKWFEHACYKKLSKLGIFDELVMNVTLTLPNNQNNGNAVTPKNELDIIGIIGTTPYLFECKSGKVKSEALYKLFSLKKAFMSLYSNITLLSYFPPETYIKEKLDDYSIKYTTGKKIMELIPSIVYSKKTSL